MRNVQKDPRSPRLFMERWNRPHPIHSIILTLRTKLKRFPDIRSIVASLWDCTMYGVTYFWKPNSSMAYDIWPDENRFNSIAMMSGTKHWNHWDFSILQIMILIERSPNISRLESLFENCLHTIEVRYKNLSERSTVERRVKVLGFCKKERDGIFQYQ